MTHLRIRTLRIEAKNLVTTNHPIDADAFTAGINRIHKIFPSVVRFAFVMALGSRSTYWTTESIQLFGMSTWQRITVDCFAGYIAILQRKLKKNLSSLNISDHIIGFNLCYSTISFIKKVDYNLITDSRLFLFAL